MPLHVFSRSSSNWLHKLEWHSSGNENIIGAILDEDLKFNAHIKSLWRKAGQKALSRVHKYLSYDQKFLLANSVIKSQFTYCPLIWIFCSYNLSYSLNHFQERALCLVRDNYNISVYRIWEMSNEKAIHQKDLEHSAKEIYKLTGYPLQ